MRQLRVRVQYQDVTHVARQGGALLRGEIEGGVGAAAQQLVQFLQLAALALPPHPAALRRIPATRTVQPQKSVTGAATTVAGVQGGDAATSRRHQFLIRGNLGCLGIDAVRQQREVQLPARTGEILTLKIAERFVYLGTRAQQDGHGHQGAKLLGHHACEVECRQDLGFNQPCNGTVHQGNDNVARRQRQQQEQQHDRHARQRRQQLPDAQHYRRGRNPKQQQITANARAADRVPQLLRPRPPIAHARFQGFAPGTN